MGQAQSELTPSSSTTTTQSQQHSSSFPSSIESLVAEAAAYGNDENESLDAKARKALECPCIADLRSGPCGAQFSDAFLCFLKSTAEEKGSDCVHPFIALQNCIKANPEAFSRDILGGGEEIEKNEATQEFRMIPPTWSSVSTSPNSKL